MIKNLSNINNIKVSVIIPVYNVECYLRQCLDTVINQTFKDIEIIVVNDCSTDSSLQIAEEYQKKDNRIKIINSKQNKGLSQTRNIGVKYAKGKYVCFVDSDDYVTNNFVECLYKTIEKYNVSFVCGTYYCYEYDKIIDRSFDFNLYDTVISDRDKKIRFLFNNNYYQAWTKIFKRKTLIDNEILFRYTNKHFIEDFVFTWEAVCRLKDFVVIKDKIYFYRSNRKNSIMNTDKINIVDMWLLSFKNLKIMLKEENLWHEYKKDFYICISLIFSYNMEIFKFKEFQFIKNLVFEYKRNYFYLYSYKYLIKNSIFNGNLNLINKVRLFLFFTSLKLNLNYKIMILPMKVLVRIMKLFKLAS